MPSMNGFESIVNWDVWITLFGTNCRCKLGLGTPSVSIVNLILTPGCVKDNPLFMVPPSLVSILWLLIENAVGVTAREDVNAPIKFKVDADNEPVTVDWNGYKLAVPITGVFLLISIKAFCWAP